MTPEGHCRRYREPPEKCFGARSGNRADRLTCRNKWNPKINRQTN